MFCADDGFSQSQKSFDKLIAQTNNYLEEYASLSPFGGYYALEDFKISKKEIKELLKSDSENFTPDKDSVDAYAMISYLQQKIIDNIYKLTAHKKFLENDITGLLQQGDLNIAVSDDKKLYNFSLYEKTGGTYHSYISVMYFTELKEARWVSAYDSEEESETNPYNIFASDGYSEIHTLDTQEGTKYVLTGSVRGCSYCFATYILVVKNAGGTLKPEFAYNLVLRSWEDSLVYNPETKTITVDYETDGLTDDCYCINEASSEKTEQETSDTDTLDEENTDTKEQESIMKQCHCIFEFNGLTFELTKECSKKVSDESETKYE